MKFPKLKPLQIVGLVAVVIFGARLVVLLLTPKRDPFMVPGAMRMQGTPADTKPLDVPPDEPFLAAPSPPPAKSAPAETTTETNPLEIGPRDARDDLYCSGIIYAFHRTQADSFSAAAQARRDKIIALAERGTAKLVSSGAVRPGETAAIADAHSERALADYANGTARFTVEEAMRR